MSKKYLEFLRNSKDVTDKDTAINNFIIYALDKLESMFTYENLPETIPAKWFEYYLMSNGNCFVIKDKGKLFAVVGGLGGEFDAYYQPTIYTVSNPALNITKNYEIDKDGVLIRNDTLMNGMLPTLRKYGTLIVESDITIRLALINMRLFNVISASDDSTKKSADEYIHNIENGTLGSIGESAFFDGVKIHNPTNLSGYLTQLIEMTQYIKASFYNELGLNANYNLKREYISTSENSLADDILLPLVDNMLAERKEGIDKINKMFGTNITVEFNSSWKANNTENEKEISQNEDAISGDDTEEHETPTGDNPTEEQETEDTEESEVKENENTETEEQTEDKEREDKEE